MSDDYELPEIIGRYRLRERIAKGGMSQIYRATDDIIGRDVAIKIIWTLDPDWKNIASSDIMNQFTQEAQISGQLSHHNFITIYDAGMQGEFCYMVMELLKGVPLSEKIKAGVESMDMRAKLEILIQVARALHHANQRGIVHCDIKPSNIMLLGNLQAKVLDFGVSHLSPGSSIKQTEGSGNIPGIGGTPYYMSPEQIAKKKLNSRADLYSLAVVAYELLTGERPFSAMNLKSLYEKILHEDPAPLKKVNKSVPENVENLVLQCLQKKRKNRLSNCKVFADKLDEILNENFLELSGAASTEGTIDTIKRYRESFQFFYDLDNQQVYNFLNVCRITKFKKDEIIFHEGAMARDMFLVMNGQVKIVKNSKGSNPYTLNVLKRGDAFGEMGIIDGAPRSATAIASASCHCLTLHQISLLHCDEVTSSKIYRNLAAILSRKLRASSNKMDTIACSTEDHA